MRHPFPAIIQSPHLSGRSRKREAAQTAQRRVYACCTSNASHLLHPQEVHSVRYRRTDSGKRFMIAKPMEFDVLIVNVQAIFRIPQHGADTNRGVH